MTPRFDMMPWLAPEAASAFRAVARRRNLKAGQAIYMQDDLGSEMYRVVSGHVRLTTRHPDGKEAVFLLFVPDDCFGVSSLVDDGTRPQTAECLSDVELDVIVRRDFESLRNDHRSFGDALLRLLARQMRIVSAHYAHTSILGLSARIALRLIELSEVESNGRDNLLSVQLPQSELAAMTGASRQSVNSILQQLQRSGVIRIENRRVVITDLRALTRIAV
jgi:CRP/FNR family cyclic AMP-dependent transcriptional regulator